MPELPEVETVRSYLEPRLVGRTLTTLIPYRQNNFLGDIESFKILEGKKIVAMERKGKFLIFSFEEGLYLCSHLRMEGKWFLREKGGVQEKHDIACLVLDGDKDLYYNDTRKFGILFLRNKDNLLATPPLSELGKEPWDMRDEELYEGLLKKNGPIKEALLDQTLMAGLGNIYDDETLFASRINPRKPASSVSKKEAALIRENADRVMKKAITLGGSTIHSYLFAPGETGSMQESLLCYGKEGQKCPNCGTPFRKIEIGGRGTTYCPVCQHEEHHPLVYAVCGPIAAGKSTVSEYLRKKGYKVLDADKMVSEIYETEEGKKILVSVFGEESIKDDKADRSFVSKEILDNVKKGKLESLIHPLVYKKMKETIESSKGGKILLDLPIWKGSPLENETDFLLYVDAPEEIRKARITKRGKDAELALALNARYPKGYLKKKAALVLDGSGGVDDLIMQLDACPFL